MSSRIMNTSIDCADPYTLAQFWSQVLGIPMDPDDSPDDDEAGLDFPDRRALLFLKVPESKAVKNRMHLCLEPEQLRDAEVDRLLGIGATMHDDRRNPDGTGWAVLLDPEGNEFCVLRSAEERVTSTQPAAPSGMTIQVEVEDIVAARDFYQTLFGRPPVFEPHDDFLEWAPAPGAEVWFQVVGVDRGAHACMTRIRFRVEDIERAHEATRDAPGAEPSPISSLPGTVSFFDFADPWGNQLGYYQDLAATQDAATYPGTSVHDEGLFTRPEASR